MQFQRTLIKRYSLVMALAAGAVLFTVPAFAGFEWTPTSSDNNGVPVVGTSVEQDPALSAPARKIIIPSKAAQQKSAPVYKAGASVQDLQRAQNQRLSQSGTAQMGSADAGSSLFIPMPGQASSQSVMGSSEQRKSEEPVPLVVENMKYLHQNQGDAVASKGSSRGFGSIKINPYPVKRDAKTGAVIDQGRGTRPQAYLAPAPAPSAVGAASALPSFVSPEMAAGSSYDVIPGFGSDIPLIMAIKQVIPPSFTYGFDARVQLDKRVSWQGDRSWDQVLQDMLKPHGYKAHIRGQRVTIR